MKQLLTAIAILALLLGLAACAGGNDARGETTRETTSVAPATEPPERTSEPDDPDGAARRCDFINMLLRTVVSPEVPGIKGGLFDADGPISRDGAREMLVTALKLEGGSADLLFADVPAGAGQASLTNAECAAIMRSVVENIVNENKEPLEVERKYLLNANNIPFDTAQATPYVFVQTYINLSPEIRVRQINGSEYWFTVKLPKDEIGLARQEVEFTVTADEYNSLMEKKEGDSIHKTRYMAHLGGHRVAVDIYQAQLAGLAVAEIQFENVEKANEFKPFGWFVKDVTSDKRYKNASLAMDGLPVD